MSLLRSREARAAAGIFALAILLRGLVLAQVRALPSFDHLLIDAVAYDAWAQRIAAGAWWGEGAFYQAPAYPYFMALIYSLGGDHVTLRVVQALLGATSCVLVFGATRLLLGFGAACLAGVGLAVYAPAIFFDTIVQKTSFGLFLTGSLMLALAALQRRDHPGIAVAAGMLLGLLALTRENALVWIPVVLLWMPLRFRDLGRGRVLGLVAAGLLGLVLVLGPVVARNKIEDDTWALTTSQIGTNFWYGNGPDATGLYVPLLPGRHTPEFESPDATRIAERESGRELTAGEVSSYWMGRTFDRLVEAPGRFVGLLVWKGLLTWNAIEIPDTEDVYVHAEWSRGLRVGLGLWHFGVLAPLGLAGLALALRDPGRRRDAWIFIAMGVVYTGGVALFLVAARFRFPLVPLLLPYAGMFLAESVTLLRSSGAAALRTPLLVGLAAAVLINLPLLDRHELSAAGHMNLAVVSFEQGDLDSAERFLLLAADRREEDADLQFQLGVLRQQQGRLDEAETHLRRSLALEPADHRTHRVLANVLQRTGRPEEARRHRRLARRHNPARPRPPPGSAPPVRPVAPDSNVE